MNRTALQILQDQLLGLDKHSKVEIHYPDDLLADIVKMKTKAARWDWSFTDPELASNMFDDLSNGSCDREDLEDYIDDKLKGV